MSPEHDVKVLRFADNSNNHYYSSTFTSFSTTPPYAMTEEDEKRTDDTDQSHLASQWALLSSKERRVQLFLARWHALNLPKWTPETQYDFLPPTLTDEQLRVARKEIDVIPEFFYKATRLPVITFANHRLFLQHIKSEHSVVALWNWFAGSGRLALCMSRPPFCQMTLESTSPCIAHYDDAYAILATYSFKAMTLSPINKEQLQQPYIHMLSVKPCAMTSLSTSTTIATRLTIM